MHPLQQIGGKAGARWNLVRSFAFGRTRELAI